MWDVFLHVHIVLMGFSGGSGGEESTCNERDTGGAGSVPGSGRFPGGGHGKPLQYSCLVNPMDRGAWWVRVHGDAKSKTQLKSLSTHAHTNLCGYMHACTHMHICACTHAPTCMCTYVKFIKTCLGTFWPIHTMKHYSAIKKNNINLWVLVWKSISIILSIKWKQGICIMMCMI